MELTEIKGVGEVTLQKLNKLGIFSVEDLVNFYPRSYLDMTKQVEPCDVEVGDFALFRGKIASVGATVRMRGGLNFFKAVFECGADKIQLVWFNYPYIRKTIMVGADYLIWGKLNQKKEYEIYNPSIELAENANRLCGISPIYSLKKIIAQTTFHKLVVNCLTKFTPTSMFDKYELSTFGEALKSLHSPKTMKELFVAKQRVYTDKLCYELTAFNLVKAYNQVDKANKYLLDIDCLKDEISRLPYALTLSQNRAISEMIADFKGAKVVNHMLVGDVGSGKTVVAFLAMIYAVKCGFQSAIIAPTEILATQHLSTANKLFGASGIKFALLTGSMPQSTKKSICARLANGEIDILIGTHAVLSENVKFRNLAFAVVDELHRFGVRQKSVLEDKAKGVDTLTMSATPIPRAIALGIYGDISISTLEAREGTGNNIETFIIGDDKLDGLYKFVGERLQNGEQAYIVCPLVEDSEGLEIFSAKALFNQLVKQKSIPNAKIGLIYGEMKDIDKQIAMTNFYDGVTNVIVATSVIEVGIDSAKASVIVVLNSDRFGLAGLHQLRGRVGRRAGLKSYCFLHTAKVAENARLLAIKENNDGFKIAEIDAELRGFGDFLGINQSGGKGILITKNMLIHCKENVDKIIGKSEIEQDEKLQSYIKQMAGIALL